jgi:hypothetical protein
MVCVRNYADLFGKEHFGQLLMRMEVPEMAEVTLIPVAR